MSNNYEFNQVVASTQWLCMFCVEECVCCKLLLQLNNDGLKRFILEKKSTFHESTAGLKTVWVNLEKSSSSRGCTVLKVCWLDNKKEDDNLSSTKPFSEKIINRRTKVSKNRKLLLQKTFGFHGRYNILINCKALESGQDDKKSSIWVQ